MEMEVNVTRSSTVHVAITATQERNSASTQLATTEEDVVILDSNLHLSADTTFACLIPTAKFKLLSVDVDDAVEALLHLVQTPPPG